MKYALVGFGFVGAIAALVLLGLATSWFGLVTSRPMARYSEETRRQTYDSSRSYYQGSVSELRRYCAAWRADEGSEKDAAADAFRSTYATYTGPDLPGDVSACIGQIH